MSFSISKDKVEEGDTVILYISATSLHALKVTNSIQNKHGEMIENVFQTVYGALKVASLIGVKYGSKVELSKGWAFILLPTPELWTLTLPHRTQIIYTPDISMILFQLEIKPGSIVIESGTGSGSLTHALARRVMPNGFVYSFDFHEQRVSVAKEEFVEHGIIDVVSVSHRDVCQNGFGIEGGADAVFLDLPHPWLVIDHAIAAFKEEGGRFCSFSPCIEQVQRTCTALTDAGYTEIRTLECIQREIAVNRRNLPVLSLDKEDDRPEDNKQHTLISTSYSQTMPGHTGFLTFASFPPKWAVGKFLI
ncbi:tRNA (adenine(58)-N(1))-methyltransferase catalytic subunit TRMT61A [Cimex lectularius]|uniref:tRNA (adenine(58)-N(1))-methyltransferase catalytic subunit TRMT61A n=1 Tax=Cimex lectularius TaxID=79782 RepID=A0A8I6RCJ7_CIMLE|nr:tRNA (adenine(58)-N(1))-methyltransferase catalytic subunit TRMT61A [Cimex lectularius]XP_014242756.1 tRNA (adenine(58)-N(1))-methyltransferase catalytic subunit TRMT61A [Cimex lectularius]XP_014242757.1 tRNA (adenine(58)-N(1))-methyltransferase catalytic subunit TRMT61A [Cimex lectularius]